MNDEPTSDALTRASAYLDGELDAPGIRAVEADPAVMVEVVRLRSLQDAIRDVPGPSSYARDLAIDAALTEFDRIHQPVVPAVGAKSRPSYGRWLAVAAAIAGVAALGAVITTTSRDGGDDFDAAGAAATTEQANATADTNATAADTNATDRAATAGGAPAVPQPEAAQSQSVLSASAAPATTAAAAGEASAESAAATTAAAAATAVPAATTPAPDTFAQFDPNTPIAGDVELGRIGRLLLTEWQSGALESKVGTPCDATLPGAVLLSDALLIVEGTTRTVLIAADPETDKVSALDPASCVVVMTGARG